MKKALIASIAGLAILIAALLALPYGMGFIAKNKFQQFIHTLSNSSRIQLSILQYHQGWLSSTAKLQVTLTPPTSRANNQKSPTVLSLSPIKFVVIEHIYHGPIIISKFEATGISHTQFGLAFFESYINQRNTSLIARTLIKFNGTMETFLQSGQFTYVDDQGLYITGQGLQAIYQIMPDQKRLSGFINTTMLQIRYGDTLQQIHGLYLTFDGKQNAKGVWLGKKTTTIARIAFVFNGKKNLIVSGIHAKSSNDEQNQHLDSQIDISINRLTFNTETIGPLQLNMDINNINTAILKQINHQNDLLQAQGQKTPKATLDKLQHLTLQLFNKGIAVELKTLNLMTQWGNLNAKGRVVFTKPTTSPKLKKNATNNLVANTQFIVSSRLLTHALEKYYARQKTSSTDISVKQIKAAAKKVAQQQIAKWITAGYIIVDKDKYKIHIGFQQDELSFNGKPINRHPKKQQPQILFG